MSDKTMTLDALRDWHAEGANACSDRGDEAGCIFHSEAADAITRYLSQPAERVSEAIAEALHIYDGWMLDDDFDAHRVLRRVVAVLQSAASPAPSPARGDGGEGCDVCGGDCAGASPPVIHCPMKDTRPMTAPDDVRARFEAEFSKPPFEFQVDRWGAYSTWKGQYRAYHVQCAWEAYRAAHADLSGEVRELVERWERNALHAGFKKPVQATYLAAADELKAALAKFTQEKP